MKGKRRTKCHWMQGSYTVEMALIFPLILGVILFILGLTFYLYDICIMDISANLTMINAEKEMYASVRSLERKLTKFAMDDIENSLLCVSDFSVNIQVEEGDVSVCYYGDFSFPIINIFLGGIKKENRIEVKASTQRNRSVAWIRNVRKAERIEALLREDEE